MEAKTAIFLFASGLCLTPFLACSSSDTPTGKTATAIAVQSGTVDLHCANKTVTVDPSVCKTAPSADGGAEAGDDGGAGDGTTDYGPTMYGGEGDDDDCKYHVKWTAAPGKSGADFGEVSFTLSITTKVDGKALTGVPVDIEALDPQDKPPANTDGTVKEPTPGTYVIPVRFTAGTSSKWTIRFHIHDDCNDSATSPHGHAAFFVQIDVK